MKKVVYIGDIFSHYLKHLNLFKGEFSNNIVYNGICTYAFKYVLILKFNKYNILPLWAHPVELTKVTDLTGYLQLDSGKVRSEIQNPFNPTIFCQVQVELL